MGIEEEKMTETAAREILNVEQAAEFLGFSAYTVREKARLGEIPGRKVGREWRFLREVLLEWLRDGEAPRHHGPVVLVERDLGSGVYMATVRGVPDVSGKGRTADEAIQDVIVDLERASYAEKYRRELPDDS